MQRGPRPAAGPAPIARRRRLATTNVLASEVYSFGIISWELLTLARRPWLRDRERAQRYNEGAVIKMVAFDRGAAAAPAAADGRKGLHPFCMAHDDAQLGAGAKRAADLCGDCSRR